MILVIIAIIIFLISCALVVYIAYKKKPVSPVPTTPPNPTPTPPPNPNPTPPPNPNPTPPLPPTPTPTPPPNPNPTPTPTPTPTPPPNPNPTPTPTPPPNPNPTPTPPPNPNPTPTPPLPVNPNPPPTPVPKVYTFLLMGQSNCANWGQTTSTSPNAKVFTNGTLFSTASDPLKGSDGTGGSVWTRLANLIDPLKYNITYIPTARGGTSINLWIPSATNSLFNNVKNQVESYKAKINIPITHVLWHQGESDVSMNPTEYKQKFIQIADALNLLLDKPKIYVCGATYCGSKSQALLQAQFELGDLYNRGPNTDTLTATTDRYDNCHFSNLGLDKFAKMWKEILQLI